MQAVRSSNALRSASRPPVAQVAVGVELAALVVEAVGVLVADHDTDRAEVDRVVGAAVEERRLQDSRREDDLVVARVVVRVHRGRRHAPERAVGRLVDPRHRASDLEHLRAQRVSEVVVALHLDRAVVLPGVRVADLAGAEGCQLRERLRLGLRGHPIQALDVLAHRGGDRLDHLLHARLAVGAEGLLDVELAERVSERAVGRLHAALVARLDLAGALQVLAEEAVVLAHERVGQEGRGRSRDVPAQVALPVGEAASPPRSGSSPRSTAGS